MPQVVIISSSGEKLEDKVSYALFKYEGHSLSFCGKYLDNQSNERLIIYPQYYSSSEDDVELQDIEIEDITLIEPSSFTEINHIPDHFFYVPSSVRSKHSGKTQVEWIIERYSKLENEYLKEIEMWQKITNEFILNKK